MNKWVFPILGLATIGASKLSMRDVTIIVAAIGCMGAGVVLTLGYFLYQNKRLG